jgi:hypothetical protein
MGLVKGNRVAAFAVFCAALTLFTIPAAAQEEPEQPPPHTTGWPGLGTGTTAQETMESLARAPELRRDISAKELLRERRRLDQALAALRPGTPGTVDAYVVAVALDSDPVFAREAREAGKVLSRRYNAQGRTVVLAGPDGRSSALPQGSIRSLVLALAHIAEVMDETEDVLVLYSTSHGAPQGLAYHYGDTGFGILSPAKLRDVLQELDIRRRILILSACYSGIFVDPLSSPDTAILTASYANRQSFGCEAENDWTFFGDALINRALRKPVDLQTASAEAHRDIVRWESSKRLSASLPQTVVGVGVSHWLPALEARIPATATEPVGRPSVGE